MDAHCTDGALSRSASPEEPEAELERATQELHVSAPRAVPRTAGATKQQTSKARKDPDVDSAMMGESGEERVERLSLMELHFSLKFAGPLLLILQWMICKIVMLVNGILCKPSAKSGKLFFEITLAKESEHMLSGKS